MNLQSEEMRRQLDEIISAFPQIHTSDIPGIDLYMDQVTTFLQENLRGLSRDPEDDKFLTKTMINNYVKNKVLIPPVKKKYSREHMMLLIMIYYMKSFLSIGDIREVIAPLMERYADASSDPKKDPKKDPRKDSKKDPKKELKKELQKDPHKELQKDPHEDLQKDLLTKTAGRGKETVDGQTQEIRISDIYETVMKEVEKELPIMQEEMCRSIELSEGVFADVPEEDRPVLQRFALISRLSAEVYIRKLFIEKLLDAGIESQE